jgi:outer membrane protein assembly factor BamB
MREFNLKIFQNRKTTVFVFIFLAVFVVFGCGDSNPLQIDWKPAEIFHNIVDTNSFRVLWSRSNVYIADWVTLGLATSGEKVFILGSLDINESAKLVALDVFTGDPVWEAESKDMSKIFTSEDGIYVDEDGRGGSVKKYDPATGKVLWFRQFWDSGGVLHMITYKEQLHVYLSPDKHKVLRPSNGETIVSIFPDSPPFFDSGVCGISYQTPIYTKDTIYYRSNPNLFKGDICAVDYFSGEMRWKSDLGVISNVVAKDDTALMLVESGDLLALNSSTGEEVSNLKISFDNKPFILYSTHTASGGYFLAYNTKNNILIAYLGDSRQIFAFKVIEN